MKARKTVLIAEDDARLSFLLREALRAVNANVNIETARNGRTALTRIQKGEVDLLITDIRMPIMSGVELSEKTRSLSPDTTIIWITGRGCHQVCNDAQRLDIYECLDKPIKIRPLRRIVRHVLDGRDGGAQRGCEARDG
jgi:DNA-binding NtrC family response regulator